MTFDDFNGAVAQINSASIGVFIVGYARTYLSFPGLSDARIHVGGRTMGAGGIDVSTNTVHWSVVGKPPPQRCTPAHTEHKSVTEMIPYNYDEAKTFEHRVLFATGVATVNKWERNQLSLFVDQVVDSYDWPGETSGGQP